MTVKNIAGELDMKVLTGDVGLDNEIDGVYIGDLLSWVMSHAAKGNLWITVLTNLNIVAVALLSEVSCIVIPEGIPVEEATINKAKKENIPILSSGRTGYELSALLSVKLKK